MPGYFLNLEQKIQKYSLINKKFKFTLLHFIFFIHNIFLEFSYNKNLKYIFSFFNKFQCFDNLLVFQSIFESFADPLKFYSSQFFLPKIFPFSFFLFYKKSPFKLILEDSNRTSLQLKYSLPLIKNSQNLQLYDYLYFI